MIHSIFSSFQFCLEFALLKRVSLISEIISFGPVEQKELVLPSPTPKRKEDKMNKMKSTLRLSLVYPKLMARIRKMKIAAICEIQH